MQIDLAEAVFACVVADVIISSWCGKKFRPEKLAKRPSFDRIPAVKYGALHEIKSPLILQPGPAELTDGLAALQN